MENKLVTVELSPMDEACLHHDLLDIDQWVRDAVRGKVASCRTRLLAQWLPVLLQDPHIETLPANPEKLVEVILAYPGYRPRKDREVV
ncbi:MAG: hypothetical protein HQL56_05600 [Magnetococcales bacterium]|nr:hypothetical protein [Magnetococcales bacterium]